MILALITLIICRGSCTADGTTVGSLSASENVKVVYESPTSLCSVGKRAYLCTPPFTNIAEGMPVTATSTCGQSDHTEQVCRRWSTPDSPKPRTYCEPCDARKRATNRGPERLTDRHVTSNQTCWVSGRVAAGATVNLTLSLGKRFEIFYISLQPCGPLPDSIALYKSSDFGRTWKPWQYFSTDCYRAYGLPTSSEHSAQISSANIQEVLCVALRSPAMYNAQGRVSNVIAFSTTIGRSTSQTWSPALIDWMTMTDLKISLSRFPIRRKSGPTEGDPNDSAAVLQRRDRSSNHRRKTASQRTAVFRLGENHLFHQEEKMQADGSALNTTATGGITKTTAGTIPTARQKNPDANASPGREELEDVVHFAFSDLTVGGMCKCNGHANRCVRDRLVERSQSGVVEEDVVTWGPLRCDCQHQTVGADCERCSPGYLDRPWARATNEDANVCKACQCNNHTSSCMFDINLYRKSAGRSGGVCLGCAHNTEGVMCQECISGYTRRTNQSSSSSEACQECQCHPIGSIGNRPCDSRTGQCHCKTGVTGSTCNRCLDGYKQTQSKIAPCAKAEDALVFTGSLTRSSPRTGVINQSAQGKTLLLKKSTPRSPTEVHKPINEKFCPPCEKDSKRFRFKKFCRQQAVFLGTVISQEIRGEFVRLAVKVFDVWRSKGSVARRHLPVHVRHNQATIVAVWAHLNTHSAVSTKTHKACICPRFRLDESYLFISQAFEIQFNERTELLLDKKCTILPWVESWRRRLMRFVDRQEGGYCDQAHSQVRFDSLLRSKSYAPQIAQFKPLQQIPSQSPIPRNYYYYHPTEFAKSSTADSYPATAMIEEERAPARPSGNRQHYRSMRHVTQPAIKQQ